MSEGCPACGSDNRPADPVHPARDSQPVRSVNTDFRSLLPSRRYLQSLAHLFEPFHFKTNEDRTLQDSEIEALNTKISPLNSTKAFFMQQSEANRPRFVLGHPAASVLQQAGELCAIHRVHSCPQAVPRSQHSSAAARKPQLIGLR
jgi:hypothetical protein